ncbi:MAG: ribosome maturation factor RimM [Rhodocyclaceae bacterium]|nr:ribosome maturation factor RimM [Rhodocyclaceae bacterium]
MVVLGRIVAPYGLKGWVKIHPFGDDAGAWRDMPEWWLSADAEGEDWTPHGIESLRFHGKGPIAKLKGVDDRAAAERLGGLYVAAPREALPETVEGEYYWADLVGLAVVNEAGESLGRVDSLLESGAHPVLVIREGDAQRLLPFVGAVVKRVDVVGGCIRVDWRRDW